MRRKARAIARKKAIEEGLDDLFGDNLDKDEEEQCEYWGYMDDFLMFDLLEEKWNVR